MKCPLFCIGDFTKTNILECPSFDCLKEECAWWEPNDGRCSVVVLAQFIAGMGMNISRMVEKMPRERQFRK